MFNLVKLEWAAIKAHHWRLALLALMLVGVAVIGWYAAIIPMSALMIAMFTTNTFAVEESGKLDHLYMSLPVSRRDIVRGRYAFALLLLVLGLLLTAAIVSIMPAALEFSETSLDVGFGGCLLLACFSYAFFAFANICTYPVLFKLGYAKGKAFGYYIPLGIILVAIAFLAPLALFEFSDIPVWLNFAMSNHILVSFILLDAGTLLLFASYKLSVWQFGKRNM